MQELHDVAAVRAGVYGIAPRRQGRSARYLAGRWLLAMERFHVRAVLLDDRDARVASREAVSRLVVAALSAGLPRRVLARPEHADALAEQFERRP